MLSYPNQMLITICARGGSKGISGKNIKVLNGKPLIAYTIEFAQRVRQIFPNAVIELSTEDNEIKSVALSFGVETAYTRPEVLAQDHSGKVEVIRELWKYAEKHYQKQFDYVLDLDVSSPLRTLKDIEEAFILMQNDSNALTLFSVQSSHKNPYFNMVEKQENGYFAISKQPKGGVLSRQAAPKVYDINGAFYFYRSAFLQSDAAGVITSQSLIYEMQHLCFDLDTTLDFEFMDYLLSQGKLALES